MTQWLLLSLKLAVGALIMAIGIGSTPSDFTYLLRRPGLLLRSLLAMYIVVPLAAFVLVRIFPVPASAKAALLVLAVSAGAPLLSRKLKAFNRDGYVFSLVIVSSLLAILLSPAWVALLARRFDVSAELSSMEVAKALAKGFLGPLAVGMIIRLILPKISERLADIVLKVAGAVLVIAGLMLLGIHWKLFREVGLIGMAALVSLTFMAMAIGHSLGGPEPDHRTVLAIACATRHIGIAIIVASAFPGPKAAVIILAYMLASALISIPYLHFRHRKTLSAN